jgi:hypothetical protein
VFLASTLQIPLVAMGLGYQRPWRLGTWDRFAIPRPFTRARAIVSRPLAIPPALDRDGIEAHRAGVEQLLAHLSDAAEAWATEGMRRPGERVVRKEPSRVARWAAAVPGPVGVPLESELSRHGLEAAGRSAA